MATIDVVHILPASRLASPCHGASAPMASTQLAVGGPAGDDHEQAVEAQGIHPG